MPSHCSAEGNLSSLEGQGAWDWRPNFVGTCRFTRMGIVLQFAVLPEIGQVPVFATKEVYYAHIYIYILIHI